VAELDADLLGVGVVQVTEDDQGVPPGVRGGV
jgi:hypothetical protein